jgi:hypothetical protein
MKRLAIAAALLVAVGLAVPTAAFGWVSFGYAPRFGYGCGRPSYWGAPGWAGAYRPYVYPGYDYHAPRPYYAPPPYYGGGYYRGVPYGYRFRRGWDSGPWMGRGFDYHRNR